MAFKVVVDFDRCESNAVCMGIAPEVFEVRDDDFLYVLQETPDEALRPQGGRGGGALPEAGDLDRGHLTAPRSVAIIGASLAGVRCAGALRRGGFDGSIAIVNAEAHRPYDRPPLSKQYLAGEWDAGRIALLDEEELDSLGLEWFDGRHGAELDVDSRSVRLDDGVDLAADAVVIATGAAPRHLAGTHDVAGIHVLRTLDDATALRDALAGEPQHVVVVGAGFIGSEVASTAAGAGHRVTVVEAADVPLRRGLGEVIGAMCGSLHADHGVELRLGSAIEHVETSADSRGDRVEAVVMDDGDRLPVDVLVVGIGVEPNTAWLDGSGLALDDGVVCNEFCEATPGIFAIGDVARWYNPRFGEHMRVEHWENAISAGAYVADRLLGRTTEPFAPVPWFWSDQYGHKLQLAGRPAPGDTVEIVTGSLAERRFAAIYGRGDVLTGVFGLDRPRHVMQYRRLIEDGTSWSEALDARGDR